jgi:hypothetical protein
MRGTVKTERTINGATVRLELQPAGEGQATVVTAYRLLPGAERATRARHLELTAPIEQFHLDPDALAALEEMTP